MRGLRIPALAALIGAAYCAQTDSMEGLRKTPPGTGPRVKFDLTTRPLPEIPFPNDLATRLDPTSPTGRRVNASITAPTVVERTTRQNIDKLDGFNTFGTFSVGFDAPLNIQVFVDRHRDLDMKNDALYVFNIDPRSKHYGEATMLDLGRGSYPLSLERQDNYFLNDEHGDGTNMVLETHDEDANSNGVFDEGEDVDHDGVFDKPNTYQKGGDTYRDLMEFYEKQSNTLLIRPLVPLEQETLYAVVLTNRILGEDGQPIRSPFPYVNHVNQNDQVDALRDVLPKHGLTVDDVAFTWAFTTQTTTRDLEAIRMGMDGKGPFAYLDKEFPADCKEVLDMYPSDATDPLGNVRTNLKILHIEDFQRLLANPVVRKEIVGDEDDFRAFAESLKYLSHIVIGKFTTPFFMAQPGGIWDLDYKTGRARRTGQDVYFTMGIPKECPKGEAGCGEGREQPFPIASIAHGYTSARVEALPLMGYFARFGYAVIAIDSVGHGLNFATDPNDPINIAIRAVAQEEHLEPMVTGIYRDRSRDLNLDGINDSGGDFWTADTFHTRDIVRQSIVDWMQMFRMLRGFDGQRRFGFDVDPAAPGNELAGDFDADGTPDVGGPDNKYFGLGGSLGGILSMIIGAVEPSVVATAPISGGGGLADIGIRSTQGGVVEAVFIELLGPLVATRLDPDGQTDLVFNALDVNDESRDYYYEAANPTVKRSCPKRSGGTSHCYGHAFARQVKLAVGDKIVVRNKTSNRERFDVVDQSFAGGIRIGIPADKGDLLEILIYAPDGTLKETIDTWDFLKRHDLDGDGTANNADDDLDGDGTPNAADTDADGDGKLDASERPRSLYFVGKIYAQGTALTALHRGFGLRRQHPDMRRFMALAQLILEPGDPINYAAGYFKEVLPVRQGKPVNVLIIGTMGDTAVPVYTSVSQARAAGILGYDVPDPRYGTSQNDVLIQNHVVEAVEKLRYYKDDPRFVGQPYVDSQDEILLDPDNLDESQMDTDLPGCPSTGVGCDGDRRLLCGCHIPNLPIPLRATVDSRPAGGGESAGRSALRIPAINRTGKHGFEVPDPARRFQVGDYMAAYIGRYFMTGGKKLPEEDQPYFLGCEDNPPACHLCLEKGTCTYMPTR